MRKSRFLGILLTLVLALCVALGAAACGGAKTYSVTLPEGVEGGVVTADKTSFTEGEEVVVTATPYEGYVLSQFKVNDTSYEIDERIREFRLKPEGDIVIYAAFSLKEYTVTLAPCEHGSVSLSKTTAKTGEKITVTATPEKAYVLKAISVAREDGGAVEFNAAENSFVMPSDNVTVSVLFAKNTLPAPAPTLGADGKLTWTAVEGAAGYAVSLDEGETWTDLSSAEYQLSRGIHTVWLKSKGDGENNFDTADGDIFKDEFDARESLASFTLTLTEGVAAFEIVWTDVEHAEGYRYRLTVNDETGNWQTAQENKISVPYSDYLDVEGEVIFTAEVEALGGDTYQNITAKSEEFSITDPTFTYKPEDFVLYGEADMYFNINTPAEDVNHLKPAESEDGEISWKGTLVGVRYVDAANQAGNTVDYNEHGYAHGVITAEALAESGDEQGIYISATTGLRMEYTVTNKYGRTATCSNLIVCYHMKNTELENAFTQETIETTSGGVTIEETPIGKVLGAQALKFSNDGTSNYVECNWTAPAGTNFSNTAGFMFWLYNPNDFELQFAFAQRGQLAPLGYIAVKAHSFLCLNAYTTDYVGLAGAKTHNLVKADGTLNTWTLDVKKVAADGTSFEPAVYDFYMGTIMTEARAYTVTLPESVEGGSVTADKTSLESGNVTLTITAEEGYELESLTVNGSPVTVEGGTYTIENVDADITVAVTFKKIEYTITVGEHVNGTLEVAQKSVWGETVTVTAEPEEGYDLVKITVKGATKEYDVTENTFVMPKENVTVSAVFAKNLVKLGTPELTVSEEDSEFTVSWQAVDHASGYKYRLTVDGKAENEWHELASDATSLSVPYIDYVEMSGTTEITVEVYAVGDYETYNDGDKATSDTLTITDPTVPQLAEDKIIEVETTGGYIYYYVGDEETVGEQPYHEILPAADGCTVTVKAEMKCLVMDERLVYSAYAGTPGGIVDYDAGGFTDGVATDLASGIALSDPFQYTFTYTFTNKYGRTASAQRFITVREKDKYIPVPNVYDDATIDLAAGGGTISVENSPSAILGTKALRFHSTAATSYCEGTLTLKEQLALGEKDFQLYLYNPNPFAIRVCIGGTELGKNKGFYKIEAGGFALFDLYELSPADLKAHGMVDGDGNLQPILVDARRYDETNELTGGNLVAGEFDVWFGEIFIGKPLRAVNLPEAESVEGGSVTADKTSLRSGTVTFTVEAQEGYELESFAVNGEPVDLTEFADDNKYSITDPDDDITITASFKKKSYTITKGEHTNGSLEVRESAVWGDTVTVTAEPEEGYELVKITVKGETTEYTVTEEHTFEMPKENVTVSVTYAKKDAETLNAPTMSEVTEDDTKFTVWWQAVENASGYDYQLVVGGEEQGWEHTDGTSFDVHFSDYVERSGKTTFTANVKAHGDGVDYKDSAAATSAEFSIDDPIFTYTPEDFIKTGVDDMYFNILHPDQDANNLKPAESEGNVVTWEATLIGLEWTYTGSATWPAAAGGTVPYTNAAFGYENGVMTNETLASEQGIYVASPWGVSIAYTATNKYGRKAVCYQSIICYKADQGKVMDVWEQGTVSGLIGNYGDPSKVSVTVIENDISPVLGTEKIMKISNEGNAFVDFTWTGTADMVVGTQEELTSIAFWAYNPNDFDLTFAPHANAGSLNLKAHSYAYCNVYVGGNVAGAFLHNTVTAEGTIGAWNIDVRKTDAQGAFVPMAYDIYLGAFRVITSRA